MGWTWLFNCNPKEYALPDLVASGEVQVGSEEEWRASQHPGEMRAGDRVYHWVGGPKPGIYAISTLLGPALPDAEGNRVVTLRYDRFLDPPLLRAEIEGHQSLADLTVLRIPRGTNYKLTLAHAHALDDRCGMKPTWPFDPRALAEVMRTPLDDPEILPREGWERKVCAQTGPFLEMVQQEFQRLRPGRPTLRGGRRGSVKTCREYLDRLGQTVGEGLGLEVRVGLDDATKERTQHLFAGLILGGRPAENDLQLDSLGKKGLFQGEVPVRFPSLWYFNPERVLFGVDLSPDEVEKRSPSDLIQTVVETLVRWSDRVQEVGVGSAPGLTALFQAAVEDGSFWSDWTARADLRRERIPLIREKVQAFQRGELPLGDLRHWMLVESGHHNLWSFVFTSGGMFMNMLTQAQEGVGPEIGLSERLAAAMEPPEDEAGVRARLEGATELIREIKTRMVTMAKPGFGPGHLPYFLSYFWEILAPGRWPIFWSGSMATFLKSLGRYRPTENPEEDYLAYHRALVEVRQELETSPFWEGWPRQNSWWALEGLALWRSQKTTKIVTPPPGPKPEKQGPVLDHFLRFAAARGLQFPKEIAAAYYLALQSKPFCILTGISGTGKTKLAEIFAEFISPERQVAVSGRGASGDALFTLTVQPYMLSYGRAHIPVRARNFLPPLDVLESTKIVLHAGGKATECTLRQFKQVMTVFFKGDLAKWWAALPLGSRVDWLPGPTAGSFELRQAGSEPATELASRRYFSFVPVRPDWTDHRGLLGFHHHLDGAYHGTDFLRLLLQARCHEPSRPHFILLDEMNLARVEHYFSDFLSALETRRSDGQGGARQESFPLHDQPRCLLISGSHEPADGFFRAEADHHQCSVRCSGCPLEDFVDRPYQQDGDSDYESAKRGGFDPSHFAPPRLDVPWNVHFTGTVNVDETTYTFSPKVLDRAHVLEFQEVDLEAYFQAPEGGSVEAASEAEVREWSLDAQFPFTTGLREEARRSPALAPYRVGLAALVHLLQPSSQHFGYRVADEILSFLHCAERLDDPDIPLEVAFDRVLLQKLVPRLHGTRDRLEEPLRRVAVFCTEAGAPEEDDNGATLASRVLERLKELGSVLTTDFKQGFGSEMLLPRTATKVLALLRSLELEGFASAL